MQIKLINCLNKLANKGIHMENAGAYEALREAMSARMPFLSLEYDFPPLDYMLIEINEGMVIPDLSDLGEVVPYDSSIG